MTVAGHVLRGTGVIAVGVVLAGLVGFAVSGVFSSGLRLSRMPFVFAHALVVGLFAAGFVRYTRIDMGTELRRGPGVAVLVGLLLGGMLLYGVTGQPPGAAPRGIELLGSLIWYGLVYGSVDALLLTVIPAIALAQALGGGRARQLTQVTVALTGSLLVTALYHLGFEEFRGVSLLQPLTGNAIVTVGYLLTGNPLTPLLAHVIMHGAAVLHGMEVTTQLPPHY